MHAQKKLGNPKVHRRFLQHLGEILPPGCKLIVMTDAGFHASWFKMVKEQGWEFVGRIRGRNRVRLHKNAPWIPARDLYDRTSLQTRDLGLGTYVRSNPVDVRMVLSKRPKKGRHRLNIYGAKTYGAQ